MHSTVKMRAAPLLVGSVAGSLLAAWLVLHSLRPEDRVSNVQGMCLLILGFIFFISSSDLCCYFMFHTTRGKKFVKKYKLTLYDVMDISNKFVSAVQAVLSSCSGFVVCTFSCPRNMLRTSHFMSQAYAWFGASYFLYDMYSMYVVHHLSPKTINRLKSGSKPLKQPVAYNNENNTGPSHFFKVTDFVIHQPVIIIHHLFIGIYGLLVIVHLRKNFGDCVFGLIFLMEMSTPLVSLRGILSRLQLKQTQAYIINGMIMIVVFFICRILMFILLFKYYSRFIDVSLFEAITSLPTPCKISLPILVIPQIYWFFLMTRGAISIFHGKLTGGKQSRNPKKENQEIADWKQEVTSSLGVNGEHSAAKNYKDAR